MPNRIKKKSRKNSVFIRLRIWILLPVKNGRGWDWQNILVGRENFRAIKDIEPYSLGIRGIQALCICHSSSPQHPPPHKKKKYNKLNKSLYLIHYFTLVLGAVFTSLYTKYKQEVIAKKFGLQISRKISILIITESIFAITYVRKRTNVCTYLAWIKIFSLTISELV